MSFLPFGPECAPYGSEHFKGLPYLEGVYCEFPIAMPLFPSVLYGALKVKGALACYGVEPVSMDEQVHLAAQGMFSFEIKAVVLNLQWIWTLLGVRIFLGPLVVTVIR